MQQPCAISVIAAAITSAIGVFLLLLAGASYRQAKRNQTMTIMIDGQAEKDATAVAVLQDAVQHGQNPEAKVAAVEHSEHKLDTALQEVFAELPGDEAKVTRPAKPAKKAAKKPAKKAAKKSTKKAPAKKKAAKKKK